MPAAMALPSWLDTASRQQLLQKIRDLTEEVHRLDRLAVAQSRAYVDMQNRVRTLEAEAAAGAKGSAEPSLCISCRQPVLQQQKQDGRLAVGDDGAYDADCSELRDAGSVSAANLSRIACAFPSPDSSTSSVTPGDDAAEAQPAAVTTSTTAAAAATTVSAALPTIKIAPMTSDKPQSADTVRENSATKDTRPESTAHARRRSLPQLPRHHQASKRRRPPPLKLETIPASPAASGRATPASGRITPARPGSKSPRFAAIEPYPISGELSDAVDLAMARNSPEKLEVVKKIQVIFRQRKLEEQYQRVRNSAIRRSWLRRAGTDDDDEISLSSLQASFSTSLQGDADVAGDHARPVWAAEELEDHRSPQELAALRRMGVYYFNRDPTKGVDWLINNRILQDDAMHVAKFLKSEPGLCRKMIGELFGQISCSFSLAVLQHFTALFDLSNMTFDNALRSFLASFRLPGEAQKIEKILEVFAGQFYACNPGVFSHPDTPFVLAFSVVMLNTDAHNEANKRKMTKAQFVSNNRGIDDGADLPAEFLEQIYDRITVEEFETMPDNMSKVNTIVAKVHGLDEDFAQTHRQYEGSCTVLLEDDQEKSSNKHKRSLRQLFLFNDTLVVAKRERSSQKFKFKQMFPLLGCRLVRRHVESQSATNAKQMQAVADQYRLVTSYDQRPVLTFMHARSTNGDLGGEVMNAVDSNGHVSCLDVTDFVPLLENAIKLCERIDGERMAQIRKNRRCTEDDTVVSPARSPLRRSFGSLEDLTTRPEEAEDASVPPVGAHRPRAGSIIQKLNNVPSLLSKKFRGFQRGDSMV